MHDNESMNTKHQIKRNYTELGGHSFASKNEKGERGEESLNVAAFIILVPRELGGIHLWSPQKVISHDGPYNSVLRSQS